MGFFQKFLSLGSGRGKKRRAALHSQARAVPPLSKEELRKQQEEQEEVASRLLRSSSLRYAVVKEVDYATLPPIPHPINSLNRPQLVSPSRSSSIQTRRTYTVTIRDRKVEALTEFPNANPPLETPTRPSRDRTSSSGRVPELPPVTPKDQNRLNILRQDPSVASLLNMYDSQGHLDSKVFSNTPTASESVSSRDGRAQVKRGGSTLRQLLGDPESSHCASTTEGDISWAEAFLCEVGQGNDETTFSIYSETRKDVVVRDCAPCEGNSNTTSSSYSPYPMNIITRPAISSLAVEPSYTSDDSSVPNTQQSTRPELRPAAEVFGFLLEKRRLSNSVPKTVELTSAEPSARNVGPPEHPAHTVPVDTPSCIGPILVDPPHTGTILNHSRPVAHGSLSNGSRVGQVTVTATRASRIPRGRRSLQLSSDSPTLDPDTELLTISTEPAAKPTLIPTRNYGILQPTKNTTEHARAASHFASTSERNVTSALAPKRNAHRRSASCDSSRLIPNNWNALPYTGTAHPKELKSNDDKENISNSASAPKDIDPSGRPKSRLPVTPSHSRALLSPAGSPASSSELSPLGRKMMADLRKQRQARGKRRINQVAKAAVHV